MTFIGCDEIVKQYKLESREDSLFPGYCGSCHSDDEGGYSDLNEVDLPNGDVAYICCGWTTELKNALKKLKCKEQQNE